jgi:tetratricopeptide (TPR) repeat protein
MTEAEVLLHYLGISLFPWGQAFDYAWPPAPSLGAALPAAAAVLGLLALATRGLLRRHPLGFAAFFPFLVLAPTSSLLSLTDAAFAHRMYLPLAAVAVGTVLTARRLCGRRQTLFRAVLFTGVFALALATVRRNAVYSDPVSFWKEHLFHRPGNARAAVSLGAALQQQGRSSEAEEAFESALKFQPDLADAHNNLATLLLMNGKLEEARTRYREALRLAPNLAMAHKGMGLTLHRMGRLEEAAAEYEEALRLNPVFSDAQVQLRLIRQAQGRAPEAFRQYREALRFNPNEAAAWNNIGTLLFQQRKWREAARFFRRALELDPGYAEARDNLQKTLRENNFASP